MKRLRFERGAHRYNRLLPWLPAVLLALVLVTAVIWNYTRAESDPVLIGAGDIASCDSPGAAATAALIDHITGTVLTLGDTAYPDGSADAFARCYNPTWGRFKARTRPALGNHDYMPQFAKPYFDYFGALAGDRKRGYYSYDVGDWHIIALNSNCSHIGGCKEDSPEVQWLRTDLAAHPARCTLAYWHHPLFGSSQPFNNPAMRPVWQVLYGAGVDVVLNGHAHNYERLAPLDPNGAIDWKRGIREFIVGTGGEDHLAFTSLIPASESHNSDAFGVLKLTLHPGSYDWEFVPEAGKTFTDSGSGQCHWSTGF